MGNSVFVPGSIPLFFSSSPLRDPDIFLGFLNVFAAVTTMLWIRYTTDGGGNENAVIMFIVLLFLNCLGVCVIFIRRRVLWSRGLLIPEAEEASKREEAAQRELAKGAEEETQPQQVVAVVPDETVKRRGRKEDSLKGSNKTKKK
jgi:ABC-type transport system involved in cytochrome bd biosynthesis fused ATPase/permease subunit